MRKFLTLIHARSIRTLLPVLSAMTIGMLAASCRDEPDNPEAGVAVYQNIVTYVGDNGTHSVLQYRQVNDSPVVTLTLQGLIDSRKAPAGTRLLVTYQLPSGSPYGTDADINATSLQMIYNATVQTDASSLPDMEQTQGIYVTTLYRSGRYLNLMAQMPATDGHRKFRLIADPATLQSPVPELYLTTEADSQGGYNRKAIASLDMAPVWNLPGCQGVKIHVRNTNNKYLRTFTFTKTTGTI